MDADRRNPENQRIRELVADLQAECRGLSDENQRATNDVRRRVTWLLTFNLAVLFAVGASTFYFRGQDTARATEGKRLALAIQQNRVATCQHDNDRHAKLVGILADARARAKTKAQRAQIDLFVNVIAEKRDCSKLNPSP